MESTGEHTQASRDRPIPNYDESRCDINSSPDACAPLKNGLHCTKSEPTSSDARKEIHKTKPSYLNDIRASKRKAGVHTKRKADHEDLDPESVRTLRADDLRDQTWSLAANSFSTQVNQIGEQQLHGGRGKTDIDELPATKDQQKKHQINWLAAELKQNEDALLERISAGKQKQKNASMKYGW
jgi:hypothetical protein